MSWLEPKQQWQSTDIFSLEDWNRITGNARYLYDILDATFEWKECVLEDTAAIPYYDIINNLEENLYNLSQAVSHTDVRFVATTWHPRTSKNYTHNPSYLDFNRWERFEYNLRFAAVRLTNLYSGNFSAGSNRIRQSLGRCNTL